MDQRNETFVPHVLAITTGTRVDFPNSDRIYHNVFSLSKSEALRPRAAMRRPARKSIRFDRPGIVRVFCDIHSHMNAFILVFSHPVLRADRRRGPLSDRQRAARHLQRHRVERGLSSRSAAGRRSPDGGAAELDFIAAMTLLSSLREPHLPGERAARGAVDRRARSTWSTRASRAKAETRAAARDRADGALGRPAARRRGPRPSRTMARLIADAPKLKAAVDTNDPPTVQDIADGLSGPAQVEPAARHQHGRPRCSRRSARRSRGAIVAQPAGDPRRAPRHAKASACCPHPTASCSSSPCRSSSALDAPRCARNAQRRLPARRRARRSS